MTQDRAIEPLGVGTKNGFWYVAGRDLDKKEIRLFRLDRFSSAVKDQGRAGAFDAPTDFAMSDLLQSQARNNLCRIKVRTDKAHALRKFSSVISSDDDWDLLELSYATQGQLIRDLLWHRDDVEIIGPDEIVVTLRSALERIEALHG